MFRGLEVVEHACTVRERPKTGKAALKVPTLLQGESLPHLSQGVDTISYKLPLGVSHAARGRRTGPPRV